MSPGSGVSSRTAPVAVSTTTRSWSVFSTTRITSSERPSGDQPPATCHAGPWTSTRSVPLAMSSTTMSMSVDWRPFEENATRVPSGEVASGTERVLVQGPAWHVAGGWSPDGRSLLVMRVVENTDQDLVVVDTATGAVRELTPEPGDISNVPVGWLADGRPLAITDHRREHHYLAAYDAATGAREIIDAPHWRAQPAASSAGWRAPGRARNADSRSTLRSPRRRTPP